MSQLTTHDMAMLKRSIEEASCWAGSMTGNPDTSQLDEFEQFIADARAALQRVDGLRLTMNRMRRKGILNLHKD